MKTLLALSLAAVLVALLVFPPSFEAAISLLFAAGLTGLLVADYADVIRPRPLHRASAPVRASALERFRLAA